MSRYVLWISLLVMSLSINFVVQAESLYDPKSFQSLVADKKAFKVGDALTVMVVESARAESRAGTGSENSSKIGLGVQDTIVSKNVGFNVGGSSGGDAVTSRHGFLSAQLAVVIREIDPNGILYVVGEQTIIINGEEQKIMISGGVRQEDIATNNTVISSRLTNAHIEFSGEGVVGEAQRTGVFYQVFQWLGLI
jgi:flagellar L-ring protein FlgH